MSDELEQQRRVMTEAYREILPSCACFALEDGVVPHEGAAYLGGGVILGEQIATALRAGGLCPTAAPAVLAVAVASALFRADPRMELPEMTAGEGSQIHAAALAELRRCLEHLERRSHMIGAQMTGSTH